MSYRAVLFDVGGPLDLEFAWESAVDSAIAAACGLEGIRVDQAMIEAASEAAVEAFAPDAYAFMVEYLCGGDLATVARVSSRTRAVVGALDVFQMRPDMPALLRRLADRGLKLGIVANQPARMAERLGREGIADLFAHFGLTGLTGLRKPDPRAFTTACDALRVTPAETIMVGDRIDIDIAPAKALGMAAIQFRGGRHRRQKPRNDAETPDAVVTDVLELKAAIEALLSETPIPGPAGRSRDMDLPDLPPDVQSSLLPRDEQAFRYSFEVKRAAMGPYIVEHWGWDEVLQVRLHSDRFNEKPFFKIVWCARAVGTVSMMRLADHIRFGEFYLFPEFQRQGLGSRILEHCLALADAQRLPVRLEYLKWNPVGTLYRRHGFAIIGETEILAYGAASAIVRF